MRRRTLEQLTAEDLTDAWGVDAIAEGDGTVMTIWDSKRMAPVYGKYTEPPAMPRVVILVPELTDRYLRPIEDKIRNLMAGLDAPGRLVRVVW